MHCVTRQPAPPIFESLPTFCIHPLTHNTTYASHNTNTTTSSMARDTPLTVLNYANVAAYILNAFVTYLVGTTDIFGRSNE